MEPDDPAQGLDKLFMAALVMLLEEKGGAFTYTDPEYQTISRRFGGSKGFLVHAEVKESKVGPPTVTVRLMNRQPSTTRPT